MTTRRSEWTFKAHRGDDEIVARIVVDGWMGFSTADVEVRIEIDGEVATRRGHGTVERKFGPHFPQANPVTKVAFSSIDGDVTGSGRSLKDAIEDYGSQVAKLVVEQRRRAALVEGAAAEASELARALTSLQAAGATDLADLVQIRLDNAIARREGSR